MWRVYETQEGPIDSDTVEWCTRTKSKLEIEPARINYFRELLSINNKSETYNDLPISDFWSFMLTLMGCMTGVGDISSFVTVEKHLLENEMCDIERVLLWWIHTEGHGVQMKVFDHTMYSIDRMGVNHLFRTKAFYVWKIIKEKFVGFSNFTECPENNFSSPDHLVLLYELIRTSCCGDTDELIVYCTEFVVSRLMTDNHVRLATIDRIAIDPTAAAALVNGKLDVFEAWRQLFPNFFAESGKSLQTFFHRCQNYCIACYMEDTLEQDISDIEFVPLTDPSLVCRNGVLAEDVLFFFGIDFFRARTKEVRAMHMLS